MIYPCYNIIVYAECEYIMQKLIRFSKSTQKYEKNDI